MNRDHDAVADSGYRYPRRRTAAACAAKRGRRRGRCATPASAFFRALRSIRPAAARSGARRWLRRSRSPYVCRRSRGSPSILDFSGVWLLNASYQWACTALAREEDGVPWLVRTLDWPFRGLGRHAEVARMRGSGGDFFSITWPGYVGALTAMAPFRFAACVNQAPMRRRIAHRLAAPFRLRGEYARELALAPAACRRINCCAGRSKSATIIARRGACWKRRRLRVR